MPAIGDACVLLAVLSLALPAMPELEGWQPALHLMAAGMFFCPGVSDDAWRFCSAAFYLGYAFKVMTELPHTQDHLTLWMNTSFGISMMISGHTRWMHSAAFLGTHILAISYTIFIYYLGEGSALEGFYRIDVAQYKGDVLAATSHTIILHYWPALIAHAELRRFKPHLQAVYADHGPTPSWKAFLWACIFSPLIIGIVYEQVQLRKHGSNEEAMLVNYKVPKDISPELILVNKSVVLPIQYVMYKYMLGVIEPAKEAGKKTN